MGPSTVRALALGIALALIAAAPASADPGDPTELGFRRTTPRASLLDVAGTLVLGIPASRAWGIESALRPLDGAAAVTVVLAVDDPAVREAFVRIAYYGRADRRSRQLAIQDSSEVRPGPGGRISVALDPPSGAVAYRVRVLARLRPEAALSRPDAIRVRRPDAAVDRGRERPAFTRLLTDLP